MPIKRSAKIELKSIEKGEKKSLFGIEVKLDPVLALFLSLNSTYDDVNWEQFEFTYTSCNFQFHEKHKILCFFMK